MTRRALLVGVLVAPVAVPAAVRGVAAEPWVFRSLVPCVFTRGRFTSLTWHFDNRLTGAADYWRAYLDLPGVDARRAAEQAMRWRDFLNEAA